MHQNVHGKALLLNRGICLRLEHVLQFLALAYAPAGPPSGGCRIQLAPTRLALHQGAPDPDRMPAISPLDNAYRPAPSRMGFNCSLTQSAISLSPPASIAAARCPSELEWQWPAHIERATDALRVRSRPCQCRRGAAGAAWRREQRAAREARWRLHPRAQSPPATQSFA